MIIERFCGILVNELTDVELWIGTLVKSILGNQPPRYLQCSMWIEKKEKTWSESYIAS